MLVVHRQTEKLFDSKVARLSEYLHRGDVLVLNNSKRLPGVLYGRTQRERAQVEIRLVRLNDNFDAFARVFPKHFVKEGTSIILEDENVLFVEEIDIPPYGLSRVRSSKANLSTLLTSFGKPITSFFYSDYFQIEHYNPFYAAEAKSIESPMAGLHLTPELLSTLQAQGVHIAYVTLHCAGSWLPFLEDEIANHETYAEDFAVSESTACIINEARRNGGRVFACGSTVVKALESASAEEGAIVAQTGSTNLYITPGFNFRVVDCYLTNFHPSGSSLMVLDASFCGKDLLLEAYNTARSGGFLFYEFGDAILYV